MSVMPCGHDINALVDVEYDDGSWGAFCEACEDDDRANSARVDICVKSACDEDADPENPDGLCAPHADDNDREWDRVTARIQRSNQ